eukprot:3741393-Alexandrium_andersonii.AAC.1
MGQYRAPRKRACRRAQPMWRARCPRLSSKPNCCRGRFGLRRAGCAWSSSEHRCRTTASAMLLHAPQGRAKSA